MSNVVEKIKEKVDNALHKNDNTGYGNTASNSNAYSTGQTHPHHHHHHHHNQQFGNTSNTASGFNGPAPTTEGPHRSDAANFMDPRVDSDADGRTNVGMASYGAGGARNDGPASNTAGPHTSNFANKIDPRVDSDADGSRNFGAAQYGAGGRQTGNTGTFGNQQHGNTGGAFTGSAAANNGPHNSSLANKLDPRVDSDAMATGPASNTAGPHSSNLANKLDPRVDSDLDGNRNVGMAQQGPGGAYNSNTASSGGVLGNRY